MLTPDYLEHAADTIVALYASLEDFIVRDIARRLMKAGAVTHSAAAQILRAQESGALYDDIIKRVSALMGESEAALRALFLDAGVQSTDADNRIYTAAGLSPAPLTLSFSAMCTLQAGLSKTGGLLFNLTKTTANAAQQAYIRAATMAEMQIESGAFDYAGAIRNAVRGLVDEAAYVQYPTGHRSRIDVAVRRAVLTGVNQTTAEISLQSAREMGCALVEVSAHVGARASHALWQGRVFCLSGTRDGYENFYSATGYGTGTGLCGWNCRHDFYPYFEGLSESAYPKSRLEEYKSKTAVWNGREMPYYDATQRQRAMERRIRDTRRGLAGYDTAIKGGNAVVKEALQNDFNSASVLLKRQEAVLRDFLQQTGLSPDANRVQVAGFGRSVSAKAVWANRHMTLTNAAGQLIIKSNRTNLRETENSIYQKETAKGGINRNFYGQHGWQTRQISNNGHGHKKEEALGHHGEHAHDYYRDSGGKLRHGSARELTALEREENGDIL